MRSASYATKKASAISYIIKNGPLVGVIVATTTALAVIAVATAVAVGISIVCLGLSIP